MLPFIRRGDVTPNAVRNPVHGCFAVLSMTAWKVWMLRYAQHDKTKSVIPSQSEECSVDAGFRSAWPCSNQRAEGANKAGLACS